MIHVVTSANSAVYQGQLDMMHQMRYEMYVKQRKWTGLQVKNDREYDEYDNDEAVYLMNISRDGVLRSTFRLLPTTSPYLLNKLHKFVDGTPPSAPHIWDMTRWMIAPSERRKPGEQRSQAQAELACGLFEFAQTRGIQHYTALADDFILPALEVAGWKYQPLGLPLPCDDGSGVAMAIMIESGISALANVRKVCKINRPMLFEVAPPRNDPDTAEVLIQAELFDAINMIDDPTERYARWQEALKIAAKHSKN